MMTLQSATLLNNLARALSGEGHPLTMADAESGGRLTARQCHPR